MRQPCVENELLCFPEVDDALLAHVPETQFLGERLFEPCYAERFHVDDFAELLHVRSGIMQLETRETQITAGPGTFLLLPGDLEHRDVFDPELGVVVFMLQFKWHGTPTLISRWPDGYQLFLSPRQRQAIAVMLAAVERDVAGGTEMDQLLARSHVLSILLYLLREAVSPEQRQSDTAQKVGQRSREIMLEAKEYLNRHYPEPISLEAIADALNVSPFHLSHVFSRENDFSLFSYLTNLRMTRAHELLRDGHMKIADVAEAVGFENSSYFSKVFRKHFGHSPTEDTC